MKTFLVQEEPRGPSMLIEILKPAATVTSQLVLPDVPQLRNQEDQTIIIKAMRIIPDAALSFSPTLGVIVSPLTELVKMTLTLFSEQWNKGQQIPIVELIDIFIEGSGIPWRNRTAQFANWQNVDWNKSFITYSNGTGGSIAGTYAVLLEVEYVKMKMIKDAAGKPTGEWQEIIGPS
jgi:hypothetical protein